MEEGGKMNGFVELAPNKLIGGAHYAHFCTACDFLPLRNFRLVILYYTAGGARCKGERGENARNMSENADEEGHTAQKRMEIIGFLTMAQQ